MNRYPSNEVMRALFGAAKSDGAKSFRIVPVRVCDHCKDESKEAFPYNLEDYNGVLYQHLCNECYDALALAQNDDDVQVCATCDSLMEWEDCYTCGGDCYIDLYDEDPLWYDEDDFELCETCGGNSGWWYCPNADKRVPNADGANV